jgi:hypothetical protein
MKDPHQWSTVTRNDRFFIMLGLLVAFVFLLPVTLLAGQIVGLLLDLPGYVLGLTPRP